MISPTTPNKQRNPKFDTLCNQYGKKQFFNQTIFIESGITDDILRDLRVEIFEVDEEFPTLSPIQLVTKFYEHRQPAVIV